MLTLIVPVYGVESYIQEFLDSLDAQGTGLDHVEVLFVDDGSPDQSARIAQAWLDGSSVRGRVISKENGGLSSARNAGIAQASGEWLSFPDPDDILSDGYLEAVITVANSAMIEEASVIATNLIYFYEYSGRQQNTHPLRHPFSHGRRLVRLDHEPQSIKLSAPSTFFRASVVREHALSFDTRIRPNFEDGAFFARYQLASPQASYVAVPDAKYIYRRRADESSLVATSWSRPEKYTEVPRYGWLETLEHAQEVKGYVPSWLQFMVFYDLQWYFLYDTNIHTPTKSITSDVKAEFMRLVEQVLAFIDSDTIVSYHITELSRLIRLSLICLKGEQPPLSTVTAWKLNHTRNAVQIRYIACDPLPSEQFLTMDHAPVVPLAAKYRRVEYFGRTIARERIVWLPLDVPFTVQLEGVRADLVFGPHSTPDWVASAPIAWRKLAHRTRPVQADPGFGAPRVADMKGDSRRSVRRKLKKRRHQFMRVLTGQSTSVKKVVDRALIRRSKSSAIRTRFEDAWVFIDRDVQAQDNAEHLYRWVAENRRDINAWFVLNRDSVDWDRLSDEGFRLVEHGSKEHTMLMLNAKHLVSSHIDHYIVSPLDRRRFGRPRWKFTFLQHGVTINDISRWINGKPIDLMIAATRAEHDWLTADASPFALTALECRLTGFPRHDSLLKKATATPSDARNLVLVMPTWREYLIGPTSGVGNRRELAEGFHESTYFTSWIEYLKSPELRGAIAKAGAELVFVPHPNLEEHLSPADLPEGVRLVRYADGDIQDLLARGRLMVSDYSSLSFEAGFVRTPVVYYQFDRDEFYAKHPHRPGYYNFEEDGFGPVVGDLQAAVDKTVMMLEKTNYAGSEFEARAEQAFTRDAGACARVVGAIESL